MLHTSVKLFIYFSKPILAQNRFSIAMIKIPYEC